MIRNTVDCLPAASLRQAMRGAVLAALATFMMAGSAFAVTDTIFRYSEPRTGYLSVATAAMTPADQASAAADYSNAYGLLKSNDPACFTTGLNPPQYAKLGHLQVYYNAVPENAFHVQLVRNEFATGSSPYVVSKYLSGSGSPYFKIPDTYATVRNDLYTYELTVCVGGGTSFSGARLIYTYNNAGD